MTFAEFLAARVSPRAKGVLHRDVSFLRPPYRLRAKFRAKGGQVKPLLVLFEQEQCSSCDELHLDIFRRKETRELLDRFDVAPIDMWSGKPLVTPKGLFTTVGEWAKALGTSISILRTK